ncbi:tRNA pseudouridine(38-40) synthase TruA, partial [Enterococcus faecium]|nr:tRNA pseudouridine(38-40) synthase TruA [Enterococcus faecium]
MRYKIILAYDGTNFAGFQMQPNQRTVEGVLKRIVNKIAKNPTPEISVYGSGRTDAGVHALGQVVHFDLSIEMSERSMLHALNSQLPLDMQVKKVE